MAVRDAPVRSRNGLLRRFFRSGEASGSGFESGSINRPPPEIIDIRPISEPDLQTVYFRLERLEAGVRLIVDTMKRTHADLSSSIESLSQQLDARDARSTVERIVAEEAAPLVASVRQLSDVVQRFPHVLAAAMEEIGVRIDAGWWKVERTLNDAVDELRRITAEGLGRPDVESWSESGLTPRPFELEPIEQQFGTNDKGGHRLALDPEQLWSGDPIPTSGSDVRTS